LTVDITALAQTAPEGRHSRFADIRWGPAEYADYRHYRLLRARRARPRRGRAAGKPCDEIPPPHVAFLAPQTYRVILRCPRITRRR
jgi:hypothetical protein